jgi:isoamylase
MESGDDMTYDERDSAPCVPKCVVVDPGFDGKGEADRHPVAWDHTSLYETHVKGFTKKHPKVPEEHRGTYKGFANKAVIDYIKALGVTSVELLPIQLAEQRHGSLLEPDPGGDCGVGPASPADAGGG